MLGVNVVRRPLVVHDVTKDRKRGRSRALHDQHRAVGPGAHGDQRARG